MQCAAAFLGHRIEVHSVLGRGSRFVVATNAAPSRPPLWFRSRRDEPGIG
jgi:hypothetical protein